MSEGICSFLLRKHLETFPLYQEDHKVLSQNISNTKLYLGYRTTQANKPKGTTHFDLNIDGTICYILWIELAKEKRGKGHGKTLYTLIENFAREAGCDRIRMTPSGQTPTRTRKEYVHELGYTDIKDSIAVEKEL
jgi:ribosomal protein S18 acetylase RimI-like enzyme